MKIGVIGGSGLYQWDTPLEERIVETPFGNPSGPIFFGKVGSTEVFFLARHGLRHQFNPSEVNYRANIYALKSLGCEALLSVSAVGSLREDLAPGTIVLPHQYIDFTKGKRQSTFFENGIVGHTHFGHPTCKGLGETLYKTAKKLNLSPKEGETYICIEGPQFSTQAESFLYRSLQPKAPTIIGMTALPEAKLAREASLCYQTIALVTDYDCWNEEAGEVSAEMVLKVMAENVSKARHLIKEFLNLATFTCHSHCRTAGKSAIVTPSSSWSASQKMTLETLLA